MRLWSIHPKYLDTSGLVALWRESLLAQKVLKGNTEGYKNHPQLIRFKNQPNQILAITQYLYYIYKEAEQRGYNFDKKKIDSTFDMKKSVDKIKITEDQLKYELDHLRKKLKNRSPQDFNKIKNIKIPDPHPSFQVIKGDIASWEKI